MRLRFDIKDYSKVYDTLVGVLGFEQGCFLTDDCIEIDEENFDTVKSILFDVEFEEI
jgi:hypothetical protein